MVALSSYCNLLSPYGPLVPSTLTAPVRQGAVNFGDGLFVGEATTNMFTNPSVETATTGWLALGAGTTNAQSTVRAFVGTTSLLTTMGSALAANTGGISFNVTSGFLANAQVYTFSCWVYVPSGNPTMYLSVQGAIVAATVNGSPSTLFGQWQRLSVTFTSSASASTSVGNIYVINSSVTGTAQQFWADAFQFENKGYATSYCDGSLGVGYAWTGTAHASTSTRAIGALQWTMPTPLSASALTIAWWMKVGAEAFQSGNFATPVFLGNTTDGFQVYLNQASGGFGVNKWAAGANSGFGSGVVFGLGDILFCALTYDSATLSFYGAKNGAVPSLLNSVATTAVPGLQTVVTLGPNGTGTMPNSPTEQLLIYNRALTLAQVQALAAASAETIFESDNGIMFAAGCGSVRGTTNAKSVGVSDPLNPSNYRIMRTVAATNEVITGGSTSNPDDVTAATHKISVPAGSGVGQGQVVGLANTPTAIGTIYTVQRVFSPGGAYDELYVA